MKKLVLVICFLLPSCATVNQQANWPKQSEGTSNVLIYRAPGAHSKLTGMFAGSANGYSVKLAEKSYAQLRIPSGIQTFKVNTHFSIPERLTIELTVDETTCLEGKANPMAWITAFTLVSGAVIPSFNLREVECPNATFFQSYKEIPTKSNN